MEYESSAKREQLSYAVEGFTAREELLLKSIIRLLDFRTVHAWQYTAYHAHLLVVDDEKTAQEDAVRNKFFHKVITLQSLKRPAMLSTEQALDANETRASSLSLLRLDTEIIIATLNDIGTNLVAQYADKVASNSQDQLITYKLKRWPIRLTSRNAGRTKIASIMLGKPLTMSDIVRLSGLSVGICEEFIVDLKADESVEVFGSLQAAAAGVQAASISLPVAALKFEAANEQSKSPSIFARIRSRLAAAILSKKP